MSEQGDSPKDADKKRKLDEMKGDDGDGESPSESETALMGKKVKTMESPATAEATGTNGPSNSSSPAPPSQLVYLQPGNIYRIQSFHLGSFHFRAGDMPFFHVNGGPVTITDSSGTVIFSGGTFRDRVEIKENVNRWFLAPRKITVHLLAGGNPRPQIQLKGNSISIHSGASDANKFINDEEPLTEHPLQLVGTPNEPIVINGQRSAVINGNGGILTSNGTGDVTVQGSLEGIRNNGSGTVKIKGSVKGEVRQTGSGSIQIDGDVHADIMNSGGGSITVRGKHLGSGTVKNVPGEGRVSITNYGRGASGHTWISGWVFGK